jgi:hypothetical protein
MNRTAATILRWGILFTLIVYLPVWGAALSITGSGYAGRLHAGGWTNRVLLAVRELIPVVVIALAVAANPKLLREKFAGPLGACLAVLVGGFLVFMLKHVELSLLPASIVLARFSAFFILPFAIRSVIERSSPRIRRLVARTVLAVLVFNLILCCAQTHLMPPFEGTTSLGSRAIGLTNNPNTAGGMLALSALLLFVPLAGQPLWMLLFCLASFLGTLTTGSRAAIGGLAVLLMFSVPRAFPKAKAPMIVIGLVLVAAVGVSLNKLSGRFEQIRSRPESPRINIARTAVAEASPGERFLGRGLGVGTNSFVTLYGLGHKLSVASDSLLISWFMQFGVVGLCLLLPNTYYLFRSLGPDGWFFFLYFVLFSITQNLIEVYPNSFLLMVIAGLYGARNRTIPHGRSRTLHDLA